MNLKDLAFLLLKTKEHLCAGIQFITNIERSLRLPGAHIGYILGTVMAMIRKKRLAGGKRMSNCTLNIYHRNWYGMQRGNLLCRIVR